MARHLYLLAVLLAGCSSDPPQAESSSDPLEGRWADRIDYASRDGALTVLRHIDSFAGPTVGDGGAASPHAVAFRTVLAEPDAPELFADLIATGEPAGQLYGLAGLKLTALAAYERELPRYLAREDSIVTAEGCVISDGTVGDVAQEIAGGGLVRDLATVPS